MTIFQIHIPHFPSVFKVRKILTLVHRNLAKIAANRFVSVLREASSFGREKMTFRPSQFEGHQPSYNCPPTANHCSNLWQENATASCLKIVIGTQIPLSNSPWTLVIDRVYSRVPQSPLDHSCLLPSSSLKTLPRPSN